MRVMLGLGGGALRQRVRGCLEALCGNLSQVASPEWVPRPTQGGSGAQAERPRVVLKRLVVVPMVHEHRRIVLMVLHGGRLSWD